MLNWNTVKVSNYVYLELFKLQVHVYNYNLNQLIVKLFKTDNSYDHIN